MNDPKIAIEILEEGIRKELNKILVLEKISEEKQSALHFEEIDEVKERIKNIQTSIAILSSFTKNDFIFG